MADKAHVALLRQGVEAWNQWRTQHPGTRPDLEVALEEPEASPFAVPPPDGPASAPTPLSEPAQGPWPYTLTNPERRRADRRQGDRRHLGSAAAPDQLVFDRRVMERRFGDRRER